MNILKRVALCFVCGVVLLGCEKVTVLDQDEKYASLIGVKYEVVQDFAIITYQGDAQKFVLHLFGDQEVPSQDEINGKFPYECYGNIVHGVLKKGSVISVEKFERHKSLEYDQVDCFVRVVKGSESPELIDASLLTNQESVPVLLPEYAVKVQGE